MKILFIALAASGVFALGALTPVDKIFAKPDDSGHRESSQTDPSENFVREEFMRWAKTRTLEKDAAVKLLDENEPGVRPLRVHVAIVNESLNSAIILNVFRVGEPGSYQAYLKTYNWIEKPANRPIKVKIHPLFRLQGQYIEASMDYIDDTLTLFGPLEDRYRNIFVVPDNEMPQTVAEIQRRFLDQLNYNDVVRYASINY